MVYYQCYSRSRHLSAVWIYMHDICVFRRTLDDVIPGCACNVLGQLANGFLICLFVLLWVMRVTMVTNLYDTISPSSNNAPGLILYPGAYQCSACGAHAATVRRILPVIMPCIAVVHQHFLSVRKLSAATQHPTSRININSTKYEAQASTSSSLQSVVVVVLD